jgi:hypothetical protein
MGAYVVAFLLLLAMVVLVARPFLVTSSSERGVEPVERLARANGSAAVGPDDADVRARVEAAVAARKAALLSVTCPSCGHPVDPTDRFCRSCGAPRAVPGGAG